MATIYFSHPKWSSENPVEIQGFKLESEIRCQECGAVLEGNERCASTIKVTGKDDKVIAEYSLFLCFNCIHKLIIDKVHKGGN